METVHSALKAGICTKPEDYKWSSRWLLGTPSALIDHDLLGTMVSPDDLLEAADMPLDTNLLETKDPGRKPRIAEDVAVGLLSAYTGADNVAAFQRLAEKDRRAAVSYLHGQGVSIRQTVRITGLSKGIVERWRMR